MFIETDDMVLIAGGHPEKGKVARVVRLALCDISRQAILSCEALDNTGAPYQFYAFGNEVQRFQAVSDKTMRRHAEHRQQRRERAAA